MLVKPYVIAFLCGLRATGAFLPAAKRHGRCEITTLGAQPIPSFLDKLPDIPNPFEALRTADSIPSVQSLDDEQTFDPSPSGLFRQAKRVVATDMGIQEPTLLDDSFKWFGPVVDESLGKTDYLAAGRFFDLRSSFLDLDYRAHDFRLDEEDPNTVRLTSRVTGTMRGELRLRGEVLPPSGKTMKCPPEAVTITFDPKSGKVVKITSGFALDRLLGNTAGSTGVIAAAMVGGKSISDWELYPVTTVLARFFGRPVKQLPEPRTFLAPFPETVMVQLAKGILAANMAAEDNSLLAKSFTYTTPTIGPIRKKEFLETYAAMEFEGVDPSFSHFRVDPYNPNVVWVDVRPSAPGYKGSPQAMSFMFDDDGFCTRISSGAIIDPTVGNGGGLAGIEGYKYATGSASPALITRPLPRALGRVRRRVISIFSGKGVDDLDVTRSSAKRIEAVSSTEKLSSLRAKTLEPAQVTAQSNDPTLQQQPLKSRPLEATPKDKTVGSGLRVGLHINLPSLPKLDLKPKQTAQPTGKPESKPKQTILSGFKLSDSLIKSVSTTTKPSSTKEPPKPLTKQQPAANTAAEENRRKATTEKALAEKAAAQRQMEEKKRVEAQRAETQRKVEESKRKQAESLAKAAKQREDTKIAAEATRLKQEEARRKEAVSKQQLEEQRRKDSLAKQKEQAAALRAAAEKKQAEAQEQKRAQEQAKKDAADKARAKAEEQKRIASRSMSQQKLEEQQKQTEEKILSKLSQVASRATIGLFGFGAAQADDDDDEPQPAATKSAPTKASQKAPFGVPTLLKWRKNFDGSVSGIISGSSSFGDGEKITTSAIAKGTIAAGEIVVTASGSKYFLS